MKALTAACAGGDGGDTSVAMTCVDPPAPQRPATRVFKSAVAVHVCGDHCCLGCQNLLSACPGR